MYPPYIWYVTKNVLNSDTLSAVAFLWNFFHEVLFQLEIDSYECVILHVFCPYSHLFPLSFSWLIFSLLQITKLSFGHVIPCFSFYIWYLYSCIKPCPTLKPTLCCYVFFIIREKMLTIYTVILILSSLKNGNIIT